MSIPKAPLIPSVLYTQGDEKVQQCAESDLAIPDPISEEGAAAIANATLQTDCIAAPIEEQQT